jgi:hypothetical protein
MPSGHPGLSSCSVHFGTDRVDGQEWIIVRSRKAQQPDRTFADRPLLARHGTKTFRDLAATSY